MESCTTDEKGLLKIEDQLCFALYSTSRAITKEYAVLLETMGVTYPQYLALMVLWQNDGILVQDIAKSLEVDQATATPLVKRLEKLGFVTRQRSAEDERRVQVFLTQSGKDLYKTALSVPQGLGCAIGVDGQRAEMLIKELNDIKAFIAQNNLR
ncbi:MarR family transcriptional regulator [Roseibium porphyridii]|uniref:MarR family transcriptional regulator n=1 Tax=Roseibium porphyridii TaxID=2866279 RepID=A0ABY8F5H5_9HYPH|nr:MULTISPECIES: MarR family transcriptional regulator [Stappiaceae]QFT34732.1 Organic hydroperoxide resistance transcriptional regulator [Labrenzia sp. THAF82]WFE89694.1 MarR family transcriptional regulator [Roseibium sp. KMA01]